MNLSTVWTPEEIAYLRSCYGLVEAEAIGKHLGRTVFSVRKRSSLLDLKGMFALAGTADLDETQEARYHELVAFFAARGINPKTIAKSVQGYILNGERSLEWLVRKALAQPENYTLRPKQEKRRVFFQEDPSDPRSRPVQLFSWALQYWSNIRVLPTARQQAISAA